MTGLALLETENSFIRRIREDEERTRAMLEPAMRQMTEIARVIEKMNEPMQRMMEAMRPSLEFAARLQESMQFSLGAYATSSFAERSEPVLEVRREVTVSRTVELSEDMLDSLAERVAERIAEKQVVQAATYRVLEPAGFTRSQIIELFEDGKRKKALTLLFRAKGWTKTATLSDALNCPSTDATRKIIAGVNERARIGLGMTEDLIESKRGAGYRINHDISIRKGQIPSGHHSDCG